MFYRKLLKIGVPDSVRSIYGLLPYTDLHTIRIDSHHIVGQFLVKSKRHPRSSTTRRNHSANHDHFDVFNQCSFTKNFLY